MIVDQIQDLAGRLFWGRCSIVCDLIDDPGGGVAGFSDHGMYYIRTLKLNVCNTRAYIHHCLSSHIRIMQKSNVRIVYIVIGGLNNSDKELECWEIFAQMWKRFCLLRSAPSPVHLRRKRWPLTGGRKLSPPFQAPVSENWLAGWLVSKKETPSRKLIIEL